MDNVAGDLIQNSYRLSELEEFALEIQASIKETHKEALNNRVKFLEERKQELIKLKLEKEENRRKRKEEKLKELERKRIEEIKEKIQTKIFSRAEIRQQINALLLSDIDNFDRQTVFGNNISLKILKLF